MGTHNCLGFTGLRSFPEWRLTHQRTQVAVQVRGNMVSNDNESLLEAARQGLGIFAAGDWLVQPDLATGALVQVLPQWQLDAESGVYFVRPSARFSTAAMVAFKQWLTAQFQGGGPWQSACG